MVEGNNVFKAYTWRKKWVRPYESIFGVLLNFCRVNVYDLQQAVRRLCKTKSKEVFDEMDIIHRNFDEDQLKNLEQILLPQNYIHGLGDIHIGEELFFTEFDQNLKYCPICMKESGYHSVIFQLKGLTHCPIHNSQRLISDGIRYNVNTYIPYFSDSNKFSISNIPLPSERVMESDVLQIEKYVKSIPILKDITYANVLFRLRNLSSENKYCEFTKLCNRQKILYMEHKDYSDIENLLLETHKQLKMLLWPDEVKWMEEFYETFKSNTMYYLYSQPVQFVEYLFVLKLLSKCSYVQFPGNYPTPSPIDSRQYPNNIIYKTIAYSEIIRGCKTTWISDEYPLQHPYSDAAIRLANYNNMNYSGLNLSICGEIINNKYECKYLEMQILFDLYQFQWKNFNRLIGNNKTFDIYKICDKLPDIRYIITKNRIGDISVYRQVEEK